MLRALVVSSLAFAGILAKEWKKEDGWIATCTAAGCPGRLAACLTYEVGGKMYYCYRSYEQDG